MVDYKEEVKKLISEMYEPADSLSKEFQTTTKSILKKLLNVMPSNAIDEHLIYEALSELGFTPKELKPLDFYWYFKRIK